jgi:hypothetical protein
MRRRAGAAAPARDEAEDGRRRSLASVRADGAMMRGERRRQSWATGLTARVGVGCGGCLAHVGDRLALELGFLM